MYWEPYADGDLHYVASTANGGRRDRDYDHRGADSYLDEDGNVAKDPTGRTAREYANPTTLVSAENGEVHDDAANFEGSPLA